LKAYQRCGVVLLAVLVAFTACTVYQEWESSSRTESIRNDLFQYQNIFEDTFRLFSLGSYHKISRENYDKNNASLIFLFEELNYKEIYSDFHGNIFFNKFEEGINFRGLVYLRNSSYVVGFIKTKSIVLDDEGKWIAHYSHGL